ncbi:DUF86 domain-containing protein [Shimazuella alba]|uniref:DUF86 domain-containing protein n=1 Tax=Shimazuella alba TaxID=2690964 RepID=A0A6I4VVC0_9BACL|nr:DUF86 domain-containing protein [Shimazuella alba]MXQ55497.1 DUF86 domain-containing protein [Shimazuella alba]
MYEINLARIQSQGEYLSTCLQVIQEIGNPTNRIEKFAIMRSFHIGVECVIDIGNTIIDGFIMRDPGGYSDIIDILEDEQVVPVYLAKSLKQFVKLREQLVRRYDEFDESQLQTYVQEAALFQTFLDHVDSFLQKEKENGNLYV